MTVTKRLISGSAASWLQIIIAVISQIVLVPVYLSFWSIQAYGIWIAIQAFIIVLSTLDLGHQTFLGFEFLRIGQAKRGETSLYLWSGVATGLVLGSVQVLVIILFLITGWSRYILTDTFSVDAATVRSAGIVLLIQAIVWLMTGSAGGVLVRALTAFNYYSRFAWWGVFSAVITAVAPAIAVSLGAHFLMTGVVSAGATVIFNLFLYVDMFRLLKKEKIPFCAPSVKLGSKNFSLSIALSVRNLLENARNSGVRMLLAPLSGVANLVAFSTIRTGANFAMQGLHSVTNPLMPELMRFLHQRDQERSETAFGTIWIIIIAVMAPAVVILQSFIGPLFVLWTRGKVPFDPMLFSVLSLSVLVYAVAQPAVAIVIGNNLLKEQLILSAIAALIVVAGMVALVPRISILGAGLALLAAEIAATAGYIMVAKSWLNKNSLKWPRYASVIAVRSVWIAGIAMAGLIWCPTGKYIIVAGSLGLMILNLLKYWQTLPAFARHRTREIIGQVLR